MGKKTINHSDAIAIVGLHPNGVEFVTTTGSVVLKEGDSITLYPDTGEEVELKLINNKLKVINHNE